MCHGINLLLICMLNLSSISITIPKGFVTSCFWVLISSYLLCVNAKVWRKIKIFWIFFHWTIRKPFKKLLDANWSCLQNFCLMLVHNFNKCCHLRNYLMSLITKDILHKSWAKHWTFRVLAFSDFARVHVNYNSLSMSHTKGIKKL